MLIRRACITAERKENGWKKRGEGRGGGKNRGKTWMEEREREKTKRILLLLPPGYEEGEVIRLTFIAFTIA